VIAAEGRVEIAAADMRMKSRPHQGLHVTVDRGHLNGHHGRAAARPRESGDHSRAAVWVGRSRPCVAPVAHARTPSRSPPPPTPPPPPETGSASLAGPRPARGEPCLEESRSQLLRGGGRGGIGGSESRAPMGGSWSESAGANGGSDRSGARGACGGIWSRTREAIIAGANRTS
jgi:hypothetical protein